MRSYDTPDGPAIFRLDALMRRFAVWTGVWMELPLVRAACAASIEVIKANKLENAYLARSPSDSQSFSVWPKGCPISVTVIAVPGKPYIPGGPEQGIRVTVSSVRRIDAATLPPFVKACGHYTNSVRAAQEAMRRGYDDALLLNAKGDYAEGSGANLFVVKNGTLITNGIDVDRHGHHARQRSQIASDLDIPADAADFTNDVRADELFFLVGGRDHADQRM
jgi:branched-chain amino acid aminotransferase